jgi:hypothetical protein
MESLLLAAVYFILTIIDVLVATISSGTMRRLCYIAAVLSLTSAFMYLCKSFLL